MSNRSSVRVVMPKKRKQTDSAKRRQYNTAFSPSMSARIDKTAEALGLDATALIRMIVHEHLHEYEQRAKDAKPASGD